jgi:hypothetical protein
MPDLRHRPGSFTQSPMGANGLRGRSAIDMRLQPWGELTAVRQGSNGYWFFTCAKPDHGESLLSGQTVRQQAKLGTPTMCPLCKAEKKGSGR